MGQPFRIERFVRELVSDDELDAAYKRARALTLPMIRAAYLGAAVGAALVAGAKRAKAWSKGRRRDR